jgi:CubicO group peptidase (beta-lactamase class C family)
MAQDTKEHKLALVAGYKATFTCSGTFNAGASMAEIQAHELRGIIPDYMPPMTKMTNVEINMDKKYVAVKYADNMPPRYAAWRPYLGCALLPIGAGPEFIQYLPKVTLPARDLSGKSKAWPVGDDAGTGQGTKPSMNAKLQKVVEAAFDMKTYEASETSAVVITTADTIIGEKYLETYGLNRPQRTWSVAKSIAATVIGMAVKDGILDVKAPTGIDEWQSLGDPRGKITLENLLHMSSGLYHGRAGNSTPWVYSGGSRVTETSTQIPLDAEPGTRWRYANNDTMLALRAFRSALKDDQAYQNYPFERLINKIGMRNTFLETDWEGNYILSSQVWTTARDLARVGILHLNKGKWQGEQLLPAGWTDYVATPAKTYTAEMIERSDWGYGAQWWLLRGHTTNDVPQEAYAARGNRGQSIVVVPSKGIVIVRRGYDDAGGARFDLAKFVADVVAALD